MGERFESSTIGQMTLTAIMALLAAAVLVWNLPASGLRADVAPTAALVLYPVGLDQDWALFAPDPRRFSVGLYARVSYADGRERIWSPPARGKFVVPYRTYRWQKFVERARADGNPQLWETTARWLARELGPGVVKVVLVRTFQEAVTPGSGDARKRTAEFSYYTWQAP
jgi:hypothetical protein